MTYNLKLEPVSLAKALSEVENLKAKLETNTQNFVDTLAQRGMYISSFKFSDALYAGDNDVTVKVEPKGFAYSAVVATGNATLFIEFGTGVVFKNPVHPDASRFGMIRGGYGYHRGRSFKGWFYQGNTGNMGTPAWKVWAKNKGLVHTYGNPANMCMYNTVKELEDMIKEVAERCFKW